MLALSGTDKVFDAMLACIHEFYFCKSQRGTAEKIGAQIGELDQIVEFHCLWMQLIPEPKSDYFARARKKQIANMKLLGR